MHSAHHKSLNNYWALAISISLTGTIVLLLLLWNQKSAPALFTVGGIFFLLSWVASRKIIKSLLAPRLLRLPRKIRGGWLALSLAFGAAWSIILSAHVPIPHQLEIRAEGKKNNMSEGYEVWLIGRMHDFSGNFDRDHFQVIKGWEKRGPELAAWRNFPAVLSWQGRLPFAGHLSFLTHPYSGKVVVSWDGVATEYDLYSQKRGVRRVTLPKTGSVRRWPAFQFCLAMVLAFVFVTISVGVFIPGARGQGES